MELLRQLFGPNDFMPHGYCYLWNPGLVWLHVLSDAAIALAYFSIPVTLIHFARKRRDLPFQWMFVLFGVFIVACGSTHVMEVWNLWHADYWLAGVVKVITAAASVPTAILLVQLVPRAVFDQQNPHRLRRRCAFDGSCLAHFFAYRVSEKALGGGAALTNCLRRIRCPCGYLTRKPWNSWR